MRHTECYNICPVCKKKVHKGNHKGKTTAINISLVEVHSSFKDTYQYKDDIATVNRNCYHNSRQLVHIECFSKLNLKVNEDE